MNPTGLNPTKKIAMFEYDFAKDGGAIGAITLRGNPVPAGAVIDAGKILIITQPTSDGSATVALKMVNANDTRAATAIASLTAGIQAAVFDGSAGNSVLTTASTSMTMTIAVAALTGGKFRVAVEYVVYN